MLAGEGSDDLVLGSESSGVERGRLPLLLRAAIRSSASCSPDSQPSFIVYTCPYVLITGGTVVMSAARTGVNVPLAWFIGS